MLEAMNFIMHFLSVVPTAPIVKDITAIDSGSVHIEWYIPTDTNGVLTSYTVSYTIEDDPEISLEVPFNGQNVIHILHGNMIHDYVQCRYRILISLD